VAFEDAEAYSRLSGPSGGGGSSPDPAVLPLALAANRLTDSLQALAPAWDSRPLLTRPRLRQVLLEALASLP
jgi:hypothetical protein